MRPVVPLVAELSADVPGLDESDPFEQLTTGAATRAITHAIRAIRRGRDVERVRVWMAMSIAPVQPAESPSRLTSRHTVGLRSGEIPASCGAARAGSWRPRGPRSQW
jgi:hypothetical protein